MLSVRRPHGASAPHCLSREYALRCAPPSSPCAAIIVDRMFRAIRFLRLDSAASSHNILSAQPRSQGPPHLPLSQLSLAPFAHPLSSPYCTSDHASGCWDMSPTGVSLR